jgi:hypothetical protein
MNNVGDSKRKEKQYREHQKKKSAGTDNRLSNHKLIMANTRLTQRINIKMTEIQPLIDLTNHHPIARNESNRDDSLLSSFLPIGSEAMMRLQLHPPSQQSIWLPTPLQPPSDIIHPMASLITDDDKIQLQEYCQFPPQTIILRLTRTPDIKLKVCDIQTLLTSGTQTHQDLLIFGLENACKIYGGTYLEPRLLPNFAAIWMGRSNTVVISN